MKKSIWILAVVFAVAACKSGGSKKGGNPACTGPTVDMSKLDGTTWVKVVVHNDGSREMEPGYRIRFSKTDDGRTKGEYIVGVDLFEMYGSATADKLDMEEKVDPKDVETIKKVNKDPSVAMQSTLYLRPKARGCRMEAMDKYKTYVDGKLIEERSPVGQYDMAPYGGKEQMSFARCTAVQELGFADKTNVAKGPGGMAAAVVGEPVTLKSSLAKSEIAEGCTDLTADLYVDGSLVKPGVTGALEGDKATWKAAYTFALPDKDGKEGYFVEMHRYAQCGGEKKLLSVACNAIPITVGG